MKIPYGKSSIQVPDLWNGRATVLTPGPFPEPDPQETVTQALDNPLGGMTLEGLCRIGDRVACVIPDLTRRAAVRQYLPVLLQRLSDVGVKRTDITIVVALGIHRPLKEAELRELVGDEIRDRYLVINHDPE